MGGDSEHIAVCPSCECRYRVPEGFQGKPLSCRKCGTVLKLGESAGAKPEGARKAEQRGQEKTVTISFDDPSLVLGRLAIKNECASEAEVRDAISFQAQEKREGRDRPLGEILLAKGVISQKQLEYLLSVQRLIKTRDLDRRFGMIAVKNGFVTQKEIDSALEEQKRLFTETGSVKLIGDILVESGVMSAAERVGVLKAQKRVGLESEAGESEKAPPQTVPGHKSAFSLAVSEDGLQASISAVAEGAERASIEEIKSLLASKGITHGILDDALIEEYLKCKIKENKPFKIAEGRAPAPGRDAEIKYYFDTDPLKVGRIKEGGYIDFKDRGAIPQVKEGDLIAEKIPPEKGEAGIDVFGKHIPAPKAKDIRVRAGKGTRTSDDRLKVFATIKGRPEITADHKLYVFPNMEIPGDVDLKTGHVDFEGNIVVGGTVQSGFRVKGGNLTANEILKAEIETSGDIVVFGGIMGATVRTRGDIRARYIHDAHIEALGDIAVEREIIDSRLDPEQA